MASRAMSQGMMGDRPQRARLQSRELSAPPVLPLAGISVIQLTSTGTPEEELILRQSVGTGRFPLGPESSKAAPTCHILRCCRSHSRVVVSADVY